MLSRFSQIFNSFSKKERLIFAGSALVFLIAGIWLLTFFVQKNTVLAPLKGGEYTEGVVGQPIFINPVLAQLNSVDSDISELVFATLKDMSDSISPGEDKRTYTVRIKGDIFWQDGQLITSDDVVFTIRAIQDPDINSPLASSWKGVKVERVSERELKIMLPAAYAYFDSILSRLRPIPKHIFENIPFTNLKLSSYNLEPVGSGLFKFSTLEKRRDGFVKQFSLIENEDSFAGEPYITSFVIKMYADEDELIDAFNSGDIDGMPLSNASKLPDVLIPYQLQKIRMPKYYAVFLNSSQNPLLKEKSVRTALDLATDKNKIVADVFDGLALPISGPVILNSAQNNFSTERANEILETNGWKLTDEGIRASEDGTKKLEFTLAVYPSPFLIETAKILKSDWEKIGVKLNINNASLVSFNDDIIKTRNYEMLIFGNIYGENMDPYSFWHSSQKFHPGLNLALYENKNADFLIDLIRNAFDENERQDNLQKLQALISGDQPAIFLYSPYYLYVANKSLKGFDEDYLALPSDRFFNAKGWYIKTSRVIK